ncbi:MAG: hypothetical protein LBE09_09465 [Christensenellaceae bacterium]|jgi:hypothetical protein|nr:hypothetical protein [Christensenellaceae bacterium]
MKALRRISVIVVALFLLALNLVVCFNLHDGTQYLADTSDAVTNKIVPLTSAEDLYKMTSSTYSDVTFLLLNDIDLNEDTSWHDVVSDHETNGWLPIQSIESNSVFDGGGHTISNLVVNRDQEYTGLFASNTVFVRNLNIDNANVTGGINAGTLAGYSNRRVYNVHVTNSNVVAKNKAGGVIGVSLCYIDNISFSGSVDGNIAGGLIGTVLRYDIENSISYANVNAHGFGGGLIGQIFNNNNSSAIISSNILNCYADANMSGYDDEIIIGTCATFIAFRDTNVFVQNCYTNDYGPAVFSGETSGITVLDENERQDKGAFEVLDFENYFAWIDSTLVQRTFSIEIDTYSDALLFLEISKDRKYYLENESAEIEISYLEDVDIPNIILDSVLLNGTPLPEISGKISEQLSEQIYITFELHYLLKVIVSGYNGGRADADKKYYEPNEIILITTKAYKNYMLQSMKATLGGTRVNIMKIGDSAYAIKTTAIKFTKYSILEVEFNYTIDPSTTLRDDVISVEEYLSYFAKPLTILLIIGSLLLLGVCAFIIYNIRIKKAKAKGIRCTETDNRGRASIMWAIRVIIGAIIGIVVVNAWIVGIIIVLLDYPDSLTGISLMTALEVVGLAVLVTITLMWRSYYNNMIRKLWNKFKTK